MLALYFPQTKKFLGTELFSDLASHFQSEDYSDFPLYLKENLPDLEDRYSFIPELSRLEYTIYVGQNNYQNFRPTIETVKPLQMVEDAQRINLSLNPNISLFKSRFPVWEIWEECKGAEGIPDLIHFDLQPKIKHPYYYIIDQEQDGPKAYLVKKSIYRLIDGILHGKSFGSVAEKLYSHKEPIVLAKALSTMQSLRLIDNYRVDRR